MGLLIQISLHFIHKDGLCYWECIVDLCVAWVKLKETFYKGDFFGLPFVYIMLVFSFCLNDVGVAADYLFDGYQKGDNHFMAFEID